MSIEKLTSHEIAQLDLALLPDPRTCSKALRIIGAQAAEVEQLLRAEHQTQYEAAQEWEMFCRRAESSLAAANALLDAIRGYMHSTLADSSFAVKGFAAQRVRDLLKAHLAAQPATGLEFTVRVLCAVARAHGWTLKSWGLQRYHEPEKR